MRFEFIEKLPRLLHRIGRDYGEYSRDGSSLLNYEGEAELPTLEAEGTLPVSYIYEGEAELSGLDADGDLLVGYVYHFSDDPTFEFNEFHYIYTGEYIYWNLLQAEGSLSHHYLMQGEAALQELSANGRTGMQGEATLRLYPKTEGSLHTDFILDGTAVLPSLRASGKLEAHWQGQATVPVLQADGRTGSSGQATLKPLTAEGLFIIQIQGEAALQELAADGIMGMLGEAQIRAIGAEGSWRIDDVYRGVAELQALEAEGSLIHFSIYSGQAVLQPLQAQGQADLSARHLTGTALMSGLAAEGSLLPGRVYLGEAGLLNLMAEGRLTRIWQAELLEGQAELLPIYGEGAIDGSTGPMEGVAVIPGIVVDQPRLTTENDFHVLQYKRFRQWQSWFSR